MTVQPDNATSLRFEAEVARQDASDAWELVSEMAKSLGLFMRINMHMLYHNEHDKLPLPDWAVADLRMACQYAQSLLERQAVRIVQERQARQDGGDTGSDKLAGS